MEHADTGFIVIRGTFPCKFCDKAIALLEEKGLNVEVRKFGMAELIERQAEHRHPTVPLIFHGVRKIGGYTELEAYLS